LIERDRGNGFTLEGMDFGLDFLSISLTEEDLFIVFVKCPLSHFYEQSILAFYFFLTFVVEIGNLLAEVKKQR